MTSKLIPLTPKFNLNWFYLLNLLYRYCFNAKKSHAIERNLFLYTCVFESIKIWHVSLCYFYSMYSLRIHWWLKITYLWLTMSLWHHSVLSPQASMLKFAWTTSLPKVQGPETCCFFQKIPCLSRKKNYSRCADLFVHLFPRVHYKPGTTPPSVKISTLTTIFSLTIEGICLISCIHVLGHK